MNQIPDWLNTRTGRNLLREEVRQVRLALDSIFGDQFVQIGAWGDAGLFRRLARTRRAMVVTATEVQGADAVSAPDALGITADSVDAVFLPHTLEYADDPHAVLREVDRILRPDGSLVALGFNPWSTWGARHALSRSGFPPGAQRLISDGRLCDWLRLLEFRVQHSAFYYFVAPVLRASSRKSTRAPRQDEYTARPDLSAQGGRLAGRLSPVLSSVRRVPAFAACYVLVAQKQLYCMTPLRPVWRRRPALVGGLMNPTTRNAA